MFAAIGPTISPELRARVADPERPAWERAVLVEALTMQLDPQGGDIAAEVLAETDDRPLALALLRYLGVVGRRDHLAVIRDRCQSDDLFIRAQAMSTLGLIGDERDLPLLISGMDDTSPWAALHAARGVKDAGGSDFLFEMATSDREYAALAGQVLYEEVEP
jgi:HEAT repeat protein